jgi:putative heme-binding domain-containing protein
MSLPYFVSSCLRGSILCLFAFAMATTATAQESTPERDALIVETLLRLDSFDLEAKPKTKDAVLRYLKANPGSEPFFHVIERFQIKAAAEELLELAIAKPSDTAGVKAAELLLRLDSERIDKTIAGDDSARAAALIEALGSVGGNQVIDKLSPLVTDAEKPLSIRSAAAKALGKSKPGIDLLLTSAKDKKLPEDLNFTVANIMFASLDPAIVAEAKKHIKLPASANEKPLPPLPELMRMPGDAAKGKQLFASTATCNKCHVVRGEGKEVGPNLSEIGSKLSKDALLVSILDPSAGISHNFETYVAATDDGKIISGLLVSKTDDEVVLRDANAIEHTLKTDSLEEFKKLPISLMPADLQKTMTAQNLVDVVEFLMTLKKP